MRHDIARYRHLLAARPHPLCWLDEHVSFTRMSPGQPLHRPGAAPEDWCLLVSGIAIQSVVHPDGRRQIVDLLMPGEFCCGFTTDEEENIQAIADETVVATYPLDRIERAVTSNPYLLRNICSIAFAGMARRQAHLMILGRTTVLEKLYAFLLYLQGRMPSGQNDTLKLPLSRYHIADYLATLVETVSRCFGDLKDRHLIALSGTRTIKILNGRAADPFATCRALSQSERSARVLKMNCIPEHPARVRTTVRSA